VVPKLYRRCPLNLRNQRLREPNLFKLMLLGPEHPFKSPVVRWHTACYIHRCLSLSLHVYRQNQRAFLVAIEKCQARTALMTTGGRGSEIDKVIGCNSLRGLEMNS
jgi:hypothetical protein